jgi:hypothetical protein
MKRTVPAALAVVLVVAVAYVASVFWIGRMVEQEVGTWSQTLTARDDVLVTRFDYDRGFGSGTLRYDLTWRPPETDAWYELLDEMGLLSERGFRLSGNLPVQHGPWVGGGFALARSEVSLSLPEDLRYALPQYPGQEPLVKTDVVLTFGGEARATARVIDYRGRVQGPDMHAPGDLELAGLRGSIRASDALDRVALEFTMDRVALRIPAEGLAMALSDLELTAYAEESLPRVWLGPLALRIHELALEAEGSRLEMSGLSIEGDSGVIDGKLRSSARMVVGQSRLDDHGILGADLEMILEDIDAAAYADIMQVLEASYAGTGTDADDEKLLEALGRILAGGPRLAITRAHLALVAQDDFVGSLTLALQDPPRFELEALEELLRSVVIDMEARVRIDALRNGMRSYVARDAGDSVSREVVNARSEVMLVELLEQLREVPALAISGEDIQASLSLREGRLAVGGEDLIDVVELGLMAAVGLFEGDKSSMADLGRETSSSTAEDGPLYGVLRLEFDFSPDPYPVELIAGGESNLADLLGGDCVGYVAADNADLVLDYTAGPYDLFVYINAVADTTLAILDPEGTWHCNDDAEGIGYNAGIQFVDPLSGEYSIWVGTYASGNADATLFISEMGFSR